MTVYSIASDGLSVEWSLEADSTAQVTCVGDDVYQLTRINIDPGSDPDFPESTVAEVITLIGTVTELLEPEDWTTIAQRGRPHYGRFWSAAGKVFTHDQTDGWLLDVRGDEGVTIINWPEAGDGNPDHQFGVPLSGGEVEQFREFVNSSEVSPGIRDATATWPPNLADDPAMADKDDSTAETHVYHGVAYVGEGHFPSPLLHPPETVLFTDPGGANPGPASFHAGDAHIMSGTINRFFQNIDPPVSVQPEFFAKDGSYEPTWHVSFVDGSYLDATVALTQVWIRTNAGTGLRVENSSFPGRGYGTLYFPTGFEATYANFYWNAYTSTPISEGQALDFFYLRFFDDDGNEISSVPDGDMTDQYGWWFEGQEINEFTNYEIGPAHFYSVAADTTESSATSTQVVPGVFNVGVRGIAFPDSIILPGIGYWSIYSSLEDVDPDGAVPTYSVWMHFEDADPVPVEPDMGTPRQTFLRGR